MNQYIEIEYKPGYWDIFFLLSGKHHREKAPSFLESDGDWRWYVQSKLYDRGFYFDWSNQ